MSDAADHLPPSVPGRARYLAVGFGCTVVIWAIAYICLSPVVGMAEPFVAVPVGIVLCLGGFLMGRLSGTGISSGVRLGLLIGLVNFIIIASLPDQATTGSAVLGTLAWVGGFAAASVVICTLGAMIGARYSSPECRDHDLTPAFAWVLAVTVLVLLLTGGNVTGLDAGLAVPDWLTTFGVPMIFYPMAEMKGDPKVYAEHFHRLWGVLVGLAMIMMVVHLFRSEQRAWLKRFGAAMLAAVIIQGLLGALRVIDKGIGWAVMHGVFGQLVFSGILLLTAFTSSAWVKRSEVKPIDRKLAWMLPAFLLVQLVLGALTRHLGNEYGVRSGGSMAFMMTHATVAVIVAAKIVVTAGRAWGRYGALPVLPKVGLWLLGLMVVQIVLGVSAMLLVLGNPEKDADPTGPELVITTIHQANGALMLGLSFLLAAWATRFAVPANAAEG